MEDISRNTAGPFGDVIRPIDPDKGITITDYLNALDLNVKTPLQRAFLELSELISEMPMEHMGAADDYLSIQRTAFLLWEQIDRKVMEESTKK